MSTSGPVIVCPVSRSHQQGNVSQRASDSVSSDSVSSDSVSGDSVSSDSVSSESQSPVR